MSPKIFVFLLGLVLFSSAVDARILKERKHEHKRSTVLDLDETESKQVSEKAVPSGSIFRRRKRDTPPAPADSSESMHLSSTEAQQLVKYFMQTAWEANKAEMLSSFLEQFADSDTNLTVVGWKEVHNPDGGLKEIRTVEFVIPPKPTDDDDIGNFEEDDDDDDDDDDDGGERTIPWKELNEVKEIFAPFSLLGVPASITYETYDKHANEEGVLYLTNDELYVRADGFVIYNKTTTASPEEVESFVNKTEALGKVSILRYNEKGQLQPNSVISSLLLGCVTDHYDIPDEIFLKAPEIIAEISQKYPQNEVPNKLAEAFNDKFAKYQWRVIVNPANYHLTRDVSISLSYDNLDLYEDSDKEYLVYGKEKEQQD